MISNPAGLKIQPRAPFQARDWFIRLCQFEWFADEVRISAVEEAIKVAFSGHKPTITVRRLNE